MSGKGDTPRPFSVSPATYAANYARIRWTDDPAADLREIMRQRHLAEARAVILSQSCVDWPPSQSLPHITPED